MTKLLLSALLLSFFSTSVLACKPAALSECKEMNYKVDPEHFKDLMKLVDSYQVLLTQKIVLPASRSSCFNNNFASFYAHEFHKRLRQKDGRTCNTQVEQVKNQINRLIDPESLENRSVLDKKDKKQLKREAKKVKIALMVLP